MAEGINRQKVNSLLAMAQIKKPPVDVERVAEELGFMVVPYPFDGKKKRSSPHRSRKRRQGDRR